MLMFVTRATNGGLSGMLTIFLFTQILSVDIFLELFLGLEMPY